MASERLPDPELWVDEYGDFLFRYARFMLRDATLAEDAVQDTFLAALKARETFSGRSSAKTWLVGILKRKIADHFRRLRREKPTDDTDREAAKNRFDEEGEWRKGPAMWWVTSPRKVFEKKEFWEVFERCLTDLPTRLADAFLLREMEGLATDEICGVLEVSDNNLWVMLHRARLRLRDCLESNWFQRGKRKDT